MAQAHDVPPLKPAWFHILVSLGEAPRHGYALKADVEARTGGRVKLWPATLYGSIRQMEEEGLIVEQPDAAEPGDDPRRRYYALTAVGRAALAAEAERLRAMADAAAQALRNA